MIRDLAGNPIVNAQTYIQNGDESFFSVQIDCETGYELSSTVNADMTIYGRLFGDVSWINLETTPIDLGTWNGTRRVFEFRLVGGSITAYGTSQFILRVVRG